jgi:hypothetical protein
MHFNVLWFSLSSLSSTRSARLGNFKCLFHNISYILLWVLSWSFYSFVFIGTGEIGLYVLLRSTPAISSFFFLIIHRVLCMKFVDFGWPGKN